MEHALISFFYSTFPSTEKAKEVATLLLEKKFVACANLIPQTQSLYFWEGNLQTEEECIVLLKAPRENYAQIEQALKACHPYNCYCLAEIPLASCNADFLQWATQQSTPSL